jgi:SAM-dependent methyltransferase
MAAAESFSETSAAWDRVHTDTRWNVWVPAEDVARFAARHLFQRTGPREIEPRRPRGPILDLGCGVGRHIVFFAALGYDVTGIDVSPQALQASQAWLDREGLSAKLQVAPVDAVPEPDARFDTVVSHGVLDHVTLGEAHGALDEVRRVLQPGGLLHLNLRMRGSFDWGVGEEIEPGTFRLAEGHERGLPQHFWTEAEIERLLEGLRVLDWETDRRKLGRERERFDVRCAVSATLEA